jgi:hypothetical protein
MTLFCSFIFASIRWPGSMFLDFKVGEVHMQLYLFLILILDHTVSAVNANRFPLNDLATS